MSLSIICGLMVYLFRQGCARPPSPDLGNELGQICRGVDSRSLASRKACARGLEVGLCRRGMLLLERDSRGRYVSVILVTHDDSSTSNLYQIVCSEQQWRQSSEDLLMGGEWRERKRQVEESSRKEHYIYTPSRSLGLSCLWAKSFTLMKDRKSLR